MCGRFDTSHLYWRDIHEQLSGFGTVKTEPLNLQPDPDVRPTTPQLAARWDGEGWQLEKMRWGLVPFWRNGKPLKDTVKGADDGFKLTTFNCKVETCHSASTFRDAFASHALGGLQHALSAVGEFLEVHETLSCRFFGVEVGRSLRRARRGERRDATT